MCCVGMAMCMCMEGACGTVQTTDPSQRPENTPTEIRPQQRAQASACAEGFQLQLSTVLG